MDVQYAKFDASLNLQRARRRSLDAQSRDQAVVDAAKAMAVLTGSQQQSRQSSVTASRRGSIGGVPSDVTRSSRRGSVAGKPGASLQEALDAMEAEKVDQLRKSTPDPLAQLRAVDHLAGTGSSTSPMLPSRPTRHARQASVEVPAMVAEEEGTPRFSVVDSTPPRLSGGSALSARSSGSDKEARPTSDAAAATPSAVPSSEVSRPGTRSEGKSVGFLKGMLSGIKSSSSSPRPPPNASPDARSPRSGRRATGAATPRKS